MKLLFCAYLDGFGGAEKQIILLANEMLERGHNVSIVALNKNDDCYGINEKIKRYFIKNPKISFFRVFNRYFGLMKIIQEIHPDVVVNFWYQSAYLIALMPKKIVGKSLYSERADPGDKEYTGLLGIVRKLTLNRIDGFVFQSQCAANYFSDKIREKSTIIHNPIINVNNNILMPKTREKRIVTVGRLHEQKNHIFLIDAFKDFVKDYPDYKLEIYGEGPLREKIEEHIDELNLRDSVILKGNVKNVLERINSAKMFILTSDYEGMPNALMEGMSIGIPVISSNYRPLNSVFELITDGENGFIYKDKNDLLKIMKNICDNENISIKISKNEIKINETNSKKNIYDKWEDFLKRL